MISVFSFLGVGVVSVLAAVAAKVLADDARTGIPKIATALIVRAARRLPTEHQDRWREEWLADLEEMEERSRMLAHAVSCLLVASPRLRIQLVPRGTSFAERALDMLTALLAGIWISPMLLLLGLLISLDGGPVFYAQDRVGRGGRVFRVWKLRTTVVDADWRLAEHLARDPMALAEWVTTHKLKSDPRITPLGRVIRKASIDELPQLWNVFRGDMSLGWRRPDAI